MWCCLWSCAVAICIDARSMVLIVVCCVNFIALMHGACDHKTSLLWSAMPRSSCLCIKQLSQIDPHSHGNLPPPRWVGKFRSPNASPLRCGPPTQITSHLCTCLLHHINYITAQRDVSWEMDLPDRPFCIPIQRILIAHVHIFLAVLNSTFKCILPRCSYVGPPGHCQ